jgi:tetratricopeptide (TPR) repeat protein
MKLFLRRISQARVSFSVGSSGASASALFEAEKEIAQLQAATRESLACHDFKAAQSSADSCLEATIALLGKDHVAYAAALNNVSQVHRAAGRLTDALPFAEDAVRTYERVAGKTHPSTAAALSNLGLLRVAIGSASSGVSKLDHAAAAVELLEAALSARRTAATGGPDIGVGVALYQLASAVRLAKDLTRAESLTNEAIAVLRSVAGPKSPITATALNNLGFLLKARGAYARAEAAYLEALTLRRVALGEAHQDTLITAHNIAECRRAAGNEEGAVAMQRDILRVLGHPEDETPPAINTLR